MGLQRWTDVEGTDWACAAYDHGPFCRMCTQVAKDDELLRAMLEFVGDGLLDVRCGADGELQFKTTPEGHERVDDLVKNDPDATRIYESAMLEWQMTMPDAEDG